MRCVENDLEHITSYYSTKHGKTGETSVSFNAFYGTQKVPVHGRVKMLNATEFAQFKKIPLPREDELPLEKVLTPDCHTIEALATFLNVPKEKTAKALMYTRISDGKFVFTVVRGDMQLSEAKLKNLVGDVRQATAGEAVRQAALTRTLAAEREVLRLEARNGLVAISRLRSNAASQPARSS
jgi:prolyl-tRNA synthetase